MAKGAQLRRGEPLATITAVDMLQVSKGVGVQAVATRPATITDKIMILETRITRLRVEASKR